MASVKEEKNQSNNKQPGNSLAELEERLRILEEKNMRLEEDNKKLQEKLEEKDEIDYYTEEEITDLKPKEKAKGEADEIIYEGKLEEWGQVAVKQFVSSKKSPIKIDEVAKLIKLDQHPNIVRLYGILWDGQDKANCRGYVMEYFEGQTLHDVIYDKARVYELPDICQWIEQIACGLQFLHKKGIFCLEVKPKNIFLVGNQLKLGDSGLARSVENMTSIDPLRYIAPEVLNGEKCSPYSDIYSLAITIWEIIHKIVPYCELDETEATIFKEKIIRGELGPCHLERSNKMDKRIAELIERCWQTQPSKRPSLTEVVGSMKECAISFKPTDVRHYKLSDFQPLKTLPGSIGSSGQVYTGCDRNNRHMAIKMFHNNTGIEDQKYCNREIQILKKHFHPNIVELLGVIWDGKMLKDNKRRLYDGYVMKYMELGSLHKEIHEQSLPYDLKLAVTWIHQIAEGLDYLHRADIIHRDIKPGNILLEARNHLKLADFGLARDISHSKTYPLTLGEIGTSIYIAPEVIASTRIDSTDTTDYDYGPPADVYSLGVQCIIRTPGEHMKRDSHGKIVCDISEESHELGILTDLVKNCLEENPVNRPTISDIFDYLFNKGFCQTILIMDPYSSYMAVLNSDRSKWIEQRMVLPRGSYRCGAVYLNREIHIVGCGEECKSLYKLDRNSLKLKRLADMNVGRPFIRDTCLVLDGYIWVFGGLGAGESLKSVERYDPKANKWTIMPKMKYLRVLAAAAVWNNQIIISGGRKGGFNTDTVERFNPKDSSWTKLPNMPKRLAYHSLVSYKNKIILMGGRDEKWEMHTGVYELNPDEKNPAWKSLPPMKYPSLVTTGVVLHDEIYAFKSDASLFLNRVEIFNGQHWRDGPTPPSQPILDVHPMIIPQHLANRLCNYKAE